MHCVTWLCISYSRPPQWPQRSDLVNLAWSQEWIWKFHTIYACLRTEAIRYGWLSRGYSNIEVTIEVIRYCFICMYLRLIHFMRLIHFNSYVSEESEKLTNVLQIIKGRALRRFEWLWNGQPEPTAGGATIGRWRKRSSKSSAATGDT